MSWPNHRMLHQPSHLYLSLLFYILLSSTSVITDANRKSLLLCLYDQKDTLSMHIMQNDLFFEIYVILQTRSSEVYLIQLSNSINIESTSQCISFFEHVVSIACSALWTVQEPTPFTRMKACTSNYFSISTMTDKWLRHENHVEVFTLARMVSIDR